MELNYKPFNQVMETAEVNFILNSRFDPLIYELWEFGT